MKLITLFEENENEIWFLIWDDVENLISTTNKEFDDLEIYQKKRIITNKIENKLELMENLKKNQKKNF